MLDHVGLLVSDVQKSKTFYEKALAPLGYKVLLDFGEAVGFGVDRPDFWIGAGGHEMDQGAPARHERPCGHHSHGGAARSAAGRGADGGGH